MDAVIELFNQIRDKVAPYSYVLIATATISLMLLGGMMWFRSRHTKMSEGAHTALQTLQHLVDTNVATGNEKEKDEGENFPSHDAKWNRIQTVAKNSYNEYSGTSIAPFFKIYEADALVKLKKAKEATVVLSDALSKIPAGDIKDLFSAKLALMKMDLPNKVENKVGLDELKTLASKTNNTAREMALYRLGEYFWTIKAFEEAKNYWGQLVFQHERSSQDTLGKKEPSEWVVRGKEKLRLIVNK